jgi:hypothetical protein
MHDVEVMLDFLDEGIEPVRKDIDVMELDSDCDDIPGMPEQVVEDSILASFNVDFHKNRALRRQTAERVFDGRTVVLVVAPDPLFEMEFISPKKEYVVDPGKGFPQRPCPELQYKPQQLADRVLKGGSKRDRVVVTVNKDVRIMPFEIALKCPIMGETEREQCVGGFYRIERDDISAVICASESR